MQMESKAYRGIGMEGSISRYYARVIEKHRDEYTSLAESVSATLSDGSRVLEVAPGPGTFSIELAKLGTYRITGLDISATFVAMARESAAMEHVDVNFQLGDAAHMPFDDETFDFILCRAAFKNFTQPVNALSEMRRVLRVGGRAMVIDMNHDAPSAQIDAYVSQQHHGLDALMNRLIFKLFLRRRAYTEEQFRQFIAASGFRAFTIQHANFGFEITLLKDGPLSRVVNHA
jgi:ubiquinone/menaquinone biosynthesis C-methylase UbiE